MQRKIATALIKTFLLTDEETAILQGNNRDAPITEEFFNVLDRVQVFNLNAKCN